MIRIEDLLPETQKRVKEQAEKEKPKPKEENREERIVRAKALDRERRAKVVRGAGKVLTKAIKVIGKGKEKGKQKRSTGKGKRIKGTHPDIAIQRQDIQARAMQKETVSSGSFNFGKFGNRKKKDNFSTGKWKL